MGESRVGSAFHYSRRRKSNAFLRLLGCSFVCLLSCVQRAAAAVGAIAKKQAAFSSPMLAQNAIVEFRLSEQFSLASECWQDRRSHTHSHRENERRGLLCTCALYVASNTRLRSPVCCASKCARAGLMSLPVRTNPRSGPNIARQASSMVYPNSLTWILLV